MIKPLLSERDAYMAHVLRYFVDQGETVVAVVGDAHVEGICNRWGQDVDVKKLLEVPQRGGLFQNLLVLLLIVLSAMLLVVLYRY